MKYLRMVVAGVCTVTAGVLAAIARDVMPDPYSWARYDEDIEVWVAGLCRDYHPADEFPSVCEADCYHCWAHNFYVGDPVTAPDDGDGDDDEIPDEL